MVASPRHSRCASFINPLLDAVAPCVSKFDSNITNSAGRRIICWLTSVPFAIPHFYYKVVGLTLTRYQRLYTRIELLLVLMTSVKHAWRMLEHGHTGDVLIPPSASLLFRSESVSWSLHGIVPSNQMQQWHHLLSRNESNLRSASETVCDCCLIDSATDPTTNCHLQYSHSLLPTVLSH